MKEKGSGIESKTLTFYPWDRSSTGFWDVESGLPDLRDKPAEVLAKALLSGGSHVQNTAIVELMTHGNPRKAAAVARELIKQHPIAIDSIMRDFGLFKKLLLEVPLANIPSKPEEYPKRMSAQHIQHRSMN